MNVNTGPLERFELMELIKAPVPLVECMIDREGQVSVNGVELTVREVHRFTSSGRLAFENRERILARTESLTESESGWVLPKGAYKVLFNEVVNIPLDMMAIARPRSSLLRCGVTVETAVWDSGYRGRSEALLIVHNEHGFVLTRNARLVQLLFFRLPRKVEKAYDGKYMNENLNL